MDKTIVSYDKTARDFAKNVAGLVPMSELEKFIDNLSSNTDNLSSKFVLDVGCGSGVASAALNERGCIVTGIDLSKELLKIATKTSPHSTFYEMDARELKFPEETFNGVWHCGTLLHLPSDEAYGALEETYRVLDKNGILYLSVKEGQGEGFENDKRYGGVEKWWTYFKEEDINHMLDKIGFEVLESYVVGYDDKYRNAHPWMNFFSRKN